MLMPHLFGYGLLLNLTLLAADRTQHMHTNSNEQTGLKN